MTFYHRLYTLGLPEAISPVKFKFLLLIIFQKATEQYFKKTDCLNHNNSLDQMGADFLQLFPSKCMLAMPRDGLYEDIMQMFQL